MICLPFHRYNAQRYTYIMWNSQEVYSAEGTVEQNCSIDFLPVAKHTVKTGFVNCTVVALVTDKFTLV